MNTSAKILLIIALCFTANSCTITLTFRLMNNAAVPVVVSYMPLSEEQRNEQVLAGDSVDITGWGYNKEITIAAGSTQWCYKQVDTPLAYDDFVGWWLFVKRIVKARLEPDGTIVLFKPEQQITDAALKQPRGFPLSPITDCEKPTHTPTKTSSHEDA